MAKTIEEGEVQRDAEIAQGNVVQGRWSLGLAVGNGGGLLATGGQIIAKASEPEIVALLLPSCWLFAVGLLCAGAGPGLLVARHGLAAKFLDEKISRANNNGRGEDRADEQSWLKLLFRLELATEIAAGVLFAAGVIVPLWRLSQGYQFG